MKAYIRVPQSSFKKNRNHFIFFGLLLFAFACKNDDETTPAGFISDRLNYNEVVTGTQIATISGAEFGVTSFEYEDGRVSSVTDFTEYSNEEGYNYTSENIFVFNYSSQNLESISATYSSISSFNGQTDSLEFNLTRNFTYNSDNQIIKITISGEAFDEVGEIIYTYDNQGNLKKVDEGDGYFQLFDWENNNILTESSWYDDSQNSDTNLRNYLWKKRNPIKSPFSRYLVPEKSFETNFEAYDDKVNPLGILSIIYGYSNGLFISQNNPSEVTTTYYNSDGSLDETTTNSIEYEFNSQGLPTKYNIIGDEPGTLFITYK